MSYEYGSRLCRHVYAPNAPEHNLDVMPGTIIGESPGHRLWKYHHELF